MLCRRTALAFLFITALPLSAADAPKPLAQGLNRPVGVAAGPDGRAYVTVAGTSETGGGAVLAVADATATPFASGLNDPKGIVAWKDALFVADGDRVVRIDKAGKVTPYAEAAAFPEPPQKLSAVTADERGGLYVTDLGSPKGGWALYQIVPPARNRPKIDVKLVADGQRFPELRMPTGIAMGGGGDPGGAAFHVLLLDTTGTLHSLRLADKSLTRVADGFGHGGGLAWDWYGR